MKKSIRRGLSLILAVALILCMLPAAGATTTETDAPTYEYVFTNESLGKSGTNYTFDTAVSDSKIVTAILKNTWKPARRVAVNNSTFMQNGLRNNILVKTGSLENYKKGNNFLVFEITVPESGRFDPELSY